MEQNQQILALLERIEKTNRRQLRFTQIFCGIALVAAVFCVITLVKFNQLMPQLSAITTQMQGVLGNMEQVAAELATLDMNSIVESIGSLVGDVEGLVGNVDALAVSAQDSLKQTMTKLNAINFETLNQAIEDLAAVIQPLANFVNLFGR